jgi:hypothetical protein
MDDIQTPGGLLASFSTWRELLGAVAIGALIMLFEWLRRRPRDNAREGADIASDNARGGTYEMLARENESLTAENAALREKVSALERIDALRESRFINLKRDFTIFKQMVIDGVQVELAEKYVQHSALAELDEGPK